MTDSTNKSTKYFVVHSFDDGIQDWPGAPCPFTHVDLRGDFQNEYFNEFTLLQHPWEEFAGASYIGMGHYRRFLSFQKSDLGQDVVLCHGDETKIPHAWSFMLYHSRELLERFLNLWTTNAWVDQCPELSLPAFSSWLQLSRIFYGRSLYVMPIQLFKKYRSFMLSLMPLIAQAARGMASDPCWENVYGKRAPGALCERLTSFFLEMLDHSRWKIKNAEVIELPVQSPYQRDAASTAELRDKITQLARRSR